MKREIESKDIFSLSVGIVSLILTVIFIEDIATKIGVFIMVVIVIISVYAAFMFKEVHTNSSEIKKINEKIDIYERLNKLEAKIFKGDKNE